MRVFFDSSASCFPHTGDSATKRSPTLLRLTYFPNRDAALRDAPKKALESRAFGSAWLRQNVSRSKLNR